MDISRARTAVLRLVDRMIVEAADVLKQETPRVLEAVRNVTPPAGEAGGLAQGMRRGRAAVASDAHKVFQSVSPQRAEVTDLEGVMSRYRKQGRVSMRLSPRIKASRADVRAHIARKQRRVGNLARAWSARVVRVGDGVRLQLVNRTDYAAKIPGLEGRVNKVLIKEQARIERLLQRRLVESAKQLGFRA